MILGAGFWYSAPNYIPCKRLQWTNGSRNATVGPVAMRRTTLSEHFLKDQRARQRFVDGAARYAEADRSDPFAFNRAMAHARIGMLDGDEYDATAQKGQRTVIRDGVTHTFPVTYFTDVKRA